MRVEGLGCWGTLGGPSHGTWMFDLASFAPSFAQVIHRLGGLPCLFRFFLGFLDFFHGVSRVFCGLFGIFCLKDVRGELGPCDAELGAARERPPAKPPLASAVVSIQRLV